MNTLQNITIIFPAFLIALVLHEYGHAWMAKRFGDTTAQWSGRLTLNPAAHIDIFGTIVLPIASLFFAGFFFGYAKPVPIDPRQFSNYRKGVFWVSAAGPIMNIFLGFFSAILLVLAMNFLPQTFTFYAPLIHTARALVTINFVLAIFNLIPLPPLDGSKMVESFLHYNTARKYESIQQYSFFILIGLMYTGAIRIIFYPVQFLDNFALGIASIIVKLFVG